MNQGWERKKLKDIAEYTIGLTYSPSDVSEKGMVVLRSSNIQNGKIDLSDIVRVTKAVKPKLLVKPGDILMCSRNGSARLVGKTAIIPELDEEMTFGTFMTIIRSPFNPFLSYFFASDEFRKQITRGENPSIKQVTQYMLDDVEVNLPPLPEQQRIVSLLDETFAGLAQVHANAERNLVNARDVFEAYLRKIFSKGKGWEEKCLEDLGQITSSKRIYKSEYVNDGVPFYRIKEVKELANNQEISVELYISRKRYQEIKDVFGVPKEGDILMTAVGTIGEIYVVDKDDEFYFKDGNVLWFKDFDSVDPYFLKYALRYFVEQIQRLSIGAAYKAVTIEKIEKHKIYIPPLAEQRAIVKRLDALAGETRRLEEVYQRKIEDIEELRKSILQRAFSGEL